MVRKQIKRVHLFFLVEDKEKIVELANSEMRSVSSMLRRLIAEEWKKYLLKKEKSIKTA